MSPARACAFAVLRRVFEQGAYADRAFAAEAAALSAQDRALAMRLAFGAVQRRATLDHVTDRLRDGGSKKLQRAVTAALRLGLYQLLFLDGVPQHAAVNESVELVKSSSPRATSLVNAILRRGADEGSQILAELNDRDPAQAAILHSVPEWLARMWFSELGQEDARQLLAAINEPAESALRVNTLVLDPKQARQRLPVGARIPMDLPEGLVLDAPFDAHGSALWHQGAIMPQSRASMLVARVLDPRPDQRVLDLCAAPGAKTTHAAALMRCDGLVTAVERHPGRARALMRTCQRMRADCVSVEVADAERPRRDGSYDRILVDPPCSGLGTLQSRPDRRWRLQPESIVELSNLQRRILHSAADATSPGGTIVYSVCTISETEGPKLIDRFLQARPEFGLDSLGAEHPQWAHPRVPDALQLLPHRDRTDGFFIARLRRR